MTQTGIECPNCRKHSVIQKSDTVYVCLGCDFKKDINPPPAKKPAPNLGVVAAIGLISLLVLSVLSQLRPQPKPAVFQPTQLNSNISSLKQQNAR